MIQQLLLLSLISLTCADLVEITSNSRTERLLLLTNSTEPSCSVLGSRYTCEFDYELQVEAVPDDPTTSDSLIRIQTNVNCPLNSGTLFDFQAAEEAPDLCSCFALVTTPDGMAKPCTCSVCPTGFGKSPVSFDCDFKGRPNDATPFVYDKCKSLDCALTCNGKCVGGCEEAPKECMKPMGCVPTPAPSTTPSTTPTVVASEQPSEMPSVTASQLPSPVPSVVASQMPTETGPTQVPTSQPTPEDYVPPKKIIPQEGELRPKLYDDINDRGNLNRQRRSRLRRG